MKNKRRAGTSVLPFQKERMINETPCRYFRSAIREKGMINETPCRYFHSAIPEKGMINETPCRYFRSVIPEKEMINETPCRYFRSAIPEQDLSPDRIAYRKSRFDLVAQRQIFRPITETKSRSLELMLQIQFLDKYL